MAKTPNGIGQFSGKMGGLVYAVRSGQQIVRAYQPIVSNPKSSLQRLQRAKANLVGQISKIVPYQILVGLGDSKVSRRARFLRLAMNGATSSVSVSDPNTITAKLDAPDFIFAEGAYVPTMFVNSTAVTERSIDIVLRRSEGVADVNFLASGALVVATILTTDGKYESIHYRFVDASEFSESGNLSFSLSHPSEGAYVAGIYLAPFATSDGKALRARANELFGEGSDFSASMLYNPSVLPLVWGRSSFVTERTFTPQSAKKTNEVRK